MSLISKLVAKQAEEYAAKQLEDAILFVIYAAAVDLELLAKPKPLAHAAFAFVVKHGRPTLAAVREAVANL